MTDKKTILIVDDTDLNLELAKDILASYNTLTAMSGEEALEKHELHGIDLLFTDVEMSGMDGFELGERIIESKPDLPILYGSGNPSYSKHPAVTEDNFISKPYRPATLIEKIEKMLR